MAQEENKLLNKGNFHEHEGQSQAEEIQAYTGPQPLRTRHWPKKTQRQQNPQQTRYKRLEQCQDKNRKGPLDEWQSALLFQRENFRQGCPFDEMEEVGSVISCRGYGELVISDEILAPVAEESHRAVINERLLDDIVAIGV